MDVWFRLDNSGWGETSSGIIVTWHVVMFNPWVNIIDEDGGGGHPLVLIEQGYHVTVQIL